MIKYIKKLLFGRFRSLKLSMFYALLVGIIAAAGTYFLCQIASSAYIENYYLSDERRKQRESDYLSALQEFVLNNELSSSDTETLAKWVQDNRYIYVMIYKDDKLVIESGSIKDDADKDGESGDGDDMPNDPSEDSEGNKNGTDNYPDSGFTVTFPTREDLIKYAEEKGTYPIAMSDGVPLLVSMADFTEYFYYDMMNIVSLVIAVAVMTLIIMFYFHRITTRITKLAKDVSVVASGDMEHEIRQDRIGKDEIGELTDNIENMRSSMLENIAKERAAIDSNTELITSMSHDIRTPLTVLLGYIDVMKLHASDAVMRDYITASENTALRLKKMSDDMFNYFLVFGGGVNDVDIVEYDAHTLFEQILFEHILLLREQGYTVEIRGDEILGVNGNITVKTDAPKLMRIAENIFSNVTKYADKNYPVSIYASTKGEKLVVEIVNHILQNAKDVESNGIGLKTCYKLAEAIGIDFTVEGDTETYTVMLSFNIVAR